MHWLLAHVLGDFIFQNDWMAQGKKQSSIICFVHIVFYCMPFIFVDITWWQIVLIGIQHFFQDRTNFIVWFMKFKGSGLFATGPCSPWSIIVTDNIIHIVWIGVVLDFFPGIIRHYQLLWFGV